MRWRRPFNLLAALLLSAPALPAAAQQQRIERVDLMLSSGRVIEAQIRYPRAAVGPLPAVMLFGGFRGAATVLDAVPAGAPVAAVSFDYPYDPPRRFRFPQSFRDLPALDRGIEETFEGIALLTVHLRKHAAIDPERITIVGASLGAPFAVISAARLDLPGVVIVHGFGDLRQVIAHQFIRELVPRYGAWVRPLAHVLAALLVWGFDLPAPEEAAETLQQNQRALMIVAADDDLIPAPATETLWQALQDSAAQAERIDETGAHLRGVRDPRIATLVDTALRWMNREQLL